MIAMVALDGTDIDEPIAKVRAMLASDPNVEAFYESLHDAPKSN
jgi:hypothetical protein